MEIWGTHHRRKQEGERTKNELEQAFVGERAIPDLQALDVRRRRRVRGLFNALDVLVRGGLL